MVVKFVFRFDAAYNLMNTISKSIRMPKGNRIVVHGYNHYKWVK